MPSDGFFMYDAGLVKDGGIFAGFMLAQGDFEEEGHSLELGMDVEDGVEVCLHALGAMEWVFAKSDEWQQTIRMVWEVRKMREADHRRSRHNYTHAGDEFDLQHISRDDQLPFHHIPQFPDDRPSCVSKLLRPGRVQPISTQTLPQTLPSPSGTTFTHLLHQLANTFCP